MDEGRLVFIDTAKHDPDDEQFRGKILLFNDGMDFYPDPIRFESGNRKPLSSVKVLLLNGQFIAVEDSKPLERGGK